VADSDDRPLEPAPGEDPWEFEWPDDAKELRAAEREAARRAKDVRPAPRFFTAYILGTWTVLLFPLVISLVRQAPQLFVSLVAPIAVIGLVAAFPLGMVIEALTRRMNKGVAGLIFLAIGAFIGYFWTYEIVGWIISNSEFDPELVPDPAADRIAASLLMLTATATGFVTARNLTDTVRKNAKAVYISFGVLVLFFIPSAIWAVQDLSAVYS
jgi:hypothetical protein